MYGITSEIAEQYGANYGPPEKYGTHYALPEEYIPGLTSPTVWEIYNAPPQLYDWQAANWGMATPYWKTRLAAIYGISREIAEKYGAEY